MDIQYILDPYACVSYIVSYISKGQRGLSNLLYDACNEAKKKDSDKKQQIRRIGNQFLSHFEIGAQEAAYLVVQMPLRKCSRDVVFIETNEPESRTVLLRSYSSLLELPKTSTNVESDNTLKRYKRRPKEMKKYCYADFVSWFDASFVNCKDKHLSSTEEELPEEDYSHDFEDDILYFMQENDNESENKSLIFEFKDGTLMKKRKKQKVIRYQPITLNADKECHYRQLIMLFTSWRKEETDLFHGCQTYEESYLKMKNVIAHNKSNYEKITLDLDENLLDNCDEMEDYQRFVVSPENEHQELVDTIVGSSATRSFGCFDPGSVGINQKDTFSKQYDLGQDLGIARKQLQTEQLPLKEMDQEQYRKMVQSLNQKQKEFFFNVLHHFKTSDLPMYSFLTGGAGVGKSVLLRSLYQALLKFYNSRVGENPDNIKVLLCAPTGKAAHNIGGNTIHSAFGIPVGRGFTFKPLDMHQLDTMRCKYFHLRVVFIDEISMVGNKMFNFINLRLQELKCVCKPFGGVSIVTFGDLFQLRPVMDSWIFSQSGFGLESLGCNLWKDNFTVYELDEIMRQKDDLLFAQLLNRLRIGKHLIQKDIETLKSRVLSSDNEEGELQFDNIPHLFTTRSECDIHNSKVLSRISASCKITVPALDNVSGEVSESLSGKILSKIPDDAGKTMGLQKFLHLAIGPPYELCVNVCVEDGLTNGTSCVLKKFDFRVENSDRCSIIWVELENKSSGELWRQKYANLFNVSIPKSWTPMLEVTRSFQIQHYKSYNVVRRQFPLQMAAGKTIHKAQGSTLNSAVVHFGNRKNDHIHYVGLSRERNLCNLHILKLNEKKISTSVEVAEEMNRMHREALMPLSLKPLKDDSDNSEDNFVACFNNCRSLKKHISDIKNDPYLMQADVLAFCETSVFCNDMQTEIEGFSLIFAGEECKHGLAIYHRKNVDESVSCRLNGIEIIVAKIGVIQFCFVYVPPKCASRENIASFLNLLQSIIIIEQPTVLIGDFNQNALEKSGFIDSLFKRYSFCQLITSVTTDYGTCLDHIYVNFPRKHILTFGTLESYFSDHKPVFLKINLRTFPVHQYQEDIQKD